MRFQLVALALGAAVVVAVVPSRPADSAVPRPDQQLTKSGKSVLATLRSALNARTSQLQTDLETATQNPTDVATMFGAMGDAFLLADSAAGDALYVAAADLDRIATQAVVDSTATSAPGLLVGGGGALDAAQAKIDAEAARFTKNAAAVMQKAVRAARKAFPTAAITVRTFATVGSWPIAPGTNPASTQSHWIVRAPIVLLGGTTQSGIRLYVGSRGDAPGPQLLSVYDGDGVRQMSSVPLTGIGTRRQRVNVAVTGSFPNPHGNLVVEVDRDGTGWTQAIGY